MSIKVDMTITFSKFMAFLVLVLAFVMDVLSDRKGTVLMVAFPIVVVLLTGKQGFDALKNVKGTTNETHISN